MKSKDLIVDFPRRPRQLSFDGVSRSESGRPPHPHRLSLDGGGRPRRRRDSVQFSHVATVKFYDRDDETCDKWHCVRDYNDMKIRRNGAIRELRLMFRSRRSSSDERDSIEEESEDDDDSDDDGCICLTGLERFLTDKIVRKTISCRDGCMRAVLAEQRRQAELGESDPHELGRLSEHHAEWSARRAHQIAVLNADADFRSKRDVPRMKSIA